MNRVARFLSYVEIKTKITSVFPFLMTLAYLFSSGYKIDARRTIIFFIGMFFFDLTATTINNYFDTKKNRQALDISRFSAKVVTVLLMLVSVFFGLYLFLLTDIVVLVLGGLCFLFGIVYSFGPVPISHGPYGEIISGFFYGFVIPAILFYINMPAGGLLSYSLQNGVLTARVSVRPVAGLILLSVVPFCLTANIMLANNICDVDKDISVGRYTLPYYLKDYACLAFSGFYYLAYFSVIIMVVFGLLTPLSLIILLTVLPVQKNISSFNKKQIKEETFIVSIQNFLLIIITHTILIFAGGVLL
jgi:1,4-dihydroxy-2-naphthoate octaprenyltransferase